MVSPSKTQYQKQEQHKHSTEETKANKRSHVRIQRGPKPLEKRSFYLDIKNHATTAKLESRIKELGGSIELFLVQSVTLVASDRVDRAGYVCSEKRRWGFASGGSGGLPSLRSVDAPTPTPAQTPPTPFFSSECPLSNSTNLRGWTGQRSKSRVDAMLERALIQPQQCSVDPLENAQTWGIPIWAVDKLQSWLDRIYASLKDTERPQDIKHANQQRLIPCKEAKVRHLKGSYLKFESYHRSTRPVFIELPAWPTLNLHGDPGTCPFDTNRREKCDHRPKPSIKRNDVKENRKEQVQNKEMTRRPRTTTTRARRTEQLASGYCEICRIGYRDLNKHVQTDQHLNFVKNDDNFLSLDTLINAGANVEAFLKLNRTNDIEKDCDIFSTDGQRTIHSVVLSDGKIKKSTKPLGSFEDIKMVQCNGARRNLNLKLSPPHNLRVRAKHESGHLLRSKGSPWHEVDKTEKFYEKFEGFTIKKRAKGTIWLEEEDPEDDAILQRDSTHEHENTPKVQHFKNFTEKSESADSREPRDLDVCRNNIYKHQNSEIPNLLTAAATVVTTTDGKKSNQDSPRRKDHLRTTGTATENAREHDSTVSLTTNETLRNRGKKSISEDPSKGITTVGQPLPSKLRYPDKELHSQHQHQLPDVSLSRQQQSQPSSPLSLSPPPPSPPLQQQLHQQEPTIVTCNGHSLNGAASESETCQAENKEKEKESGKINGTEVPTECYVMKHGTRDRVERNNGKYSRVGKRGGGRCAAKGRHRLSVEERLIEDNRAYYKVEVLGSKLRSSVVPSGNSIRSSPSKETAGETKKEATSSEKPVVVRFKRVRKSELSLLSDEAESFMFGEQRREDSSERSDDDRTSCETVFPRDTESSEVGLTEASMTLESSSLNPDSSAKSEAVFTHDDDSQDSVASLARARKRRRTQAEALIKDNTDYYKFEVPGSRLRYQAPLTGIKDLPRQAILTAEGNIKDSTECAHFGINSGHLKEERHTTLLAQGQQPPATDAACPPQTETIYPSKPSAEVEKMQFSFEAIPSSEPWYRTYQRQDEGAEYWHYFSEADTRKPFLLPYEIDNFHEILAKCQNRSEARKKSRGRGFGCMGRSPRKSPRCHASTLAIMSTIIRKKEQLQLQQRQDHDHLRQPEQRQHDHTVSLYTIDEHPPARSCSNTPRSDCKSDVDEELKEIARTIDEMLSAAEEDAPEVNDPLEEVDVEQSAGLSIYASAADIPKGAPPNLLELLDNCHEIGNCLENSSCASSECGEGNVESPLKRRKKRKNRTGWPGIKLKKKLQHNKTNAEAEGDRENQHRSTKISEGGRYQWAQASGESNTGFCAVACRSSDLPPKSPPVKLTARSSSPAAPSMVGSAKLASPNCENDSKRAGTNQDIAQCPGPGSRPSGGQPFNRNGLHPHETEFDLEEDGHIADKEAKCGDGVTRDSSTVHTAAGLDEAAPRGNSVRSSFERGPLTRKEYKFHKEPSNNPEIAEVSENDPGNEENHENCDYLFRKDGMPLKKRYHRENVSSDVHVSTVCSDLTGCRDCPLRKKESDTSATAAPRKIQDPSELPPRKRPAARARDAIIVTEELAMLTDHGGGSANLRSGKTTARKRIYSASKKRTRRHSNKPTDVQAPVFEDENCKKGAYFSSSCKRQPTHLGTKATKRRAEDAGIDCTLSERIAPPGSAVSSSDLEQRRSSIDFQPVVRMMKIDEHVDVDRHSILSVTVASNRRLRSSCSPRSSSAQPPKKRLKVTNPTTGSTSATTVSTTSATHVASASSSPSPTTAAVTGRGHFGRLLKGS